MAHHEDVRLVSLEGKDTRDPAVLAFTSNPDGVELIVDGIKYHVVHRISSMRFCGRVVDADRALDA